MFIPAVSKSDVVLIFFHNNNIKYQTKSQMEDIALEGIIIL